MQIETGEAVNSTFNESQKYSKASWDFLEGLAERLFT